MEAFEDVLALLGADKHVPLKRDYDEEYIARVVNRVRGLLAQAVHERNITLTELAQKLGVNRSLVTRFFNSEGDMKVSTLALIAKALGKEWDIRLSDCRESKEGSNFHRHRGEQVRKETNFGRPIVSGWENAYPIVGNDKIPLQHNSAGQGTFQNSLARETESA